MYVAVAADAGGTDVDVAGGGGNPAAAGVAGGGEVAVAKQWQNINNTWLLIRVSSICQHSLAILSVINNTYYH